MYFAFRTGEFLNELEGSHFFFDQRRKRDGGREGKRERDTERLQKADTLCPGDSARQWRLLLHNHFTPEPHFYTLSSFLV